MASRLQDYRRYQVVFLLFLLNLLAVPFALALEEPAIPSATDVNALGVLPSVAASVEATIQQDGLWKSAQSSFLVPETVYVRDQQGKPLETVTSNPQKGQYHVRLDGCIRFAGQDSGRHVTISYHYRPRQVAVLPVVAGTDYQDAVPTLLETLTKDLESRGFIMASPDDTADALVELRSTAASWTGEFTPQLVTVLATRLNAAYILLPVVDADENTVLAGFQGYTWVTDSGRSAHTVATQTKRHVMNVAVGITAFYGTTGNVAAQQTAEGSKRVHFRQFGPARRSLVRELTTRVVAKWRETPY